MNSRTTQTSIPKRGRKLSWKWQVIILFVTVITVIVIGYFFLAQQDQLSKKDFVAVEQKMDGIYKNMNLRDVDKAKDCYYYEDSMSKILKCGIKMAGYIPIKSPDDLAALTEKFGKELKLISTISNIWRTNSSDELTQNASFRVKDSHMNMACLASIGTKDGNVLSGRSLPKRDLADKAVLFLSCGGGSREPYFDMRLNPM